MAFFQFATQKKTKKKGSLNSEVDSTGSQLLRLVARVHAMIMMTAPHDDNGLAALHNICYIIIHIFA